MVDKKPKKNKKDEPEDENKSSSDEATADKQGNNEPEKGILPTGISDEMRKSYLDYAMSVITSRALPDVRDGLKPVHRRILYAMSGLGLTSSAKFKKSANVVGEVLGKYHPHGDTAIYETMVKMAQVFVSRYPLVIGQGNFGSIDGDRAAAHRYTEAKMSKISGELLRDLEKDTVDFAPNYDGTNEEPLVLPTVVPNLLLNGTLGIAVGMATNIPPHNLREVIEATIHLIENKNASTDDLLKFVKGPDFPLGGIIFNQKDIQHAYSTGRGGIVCRGEAEIVEKKAGSFQIIISSIPFRVNKADLITKIADLHRDKKIDGIKALRDESTSDIRVAIDLKSNANPQNLLNNLYKYTQLEETFHFNMVMLVGGIPQTLPLKSILEEFISHRQIVVTRRTQFELRKAEAREHILLGLKIALDNIDAIIKLIKASKTVSDARTSLMKKFKLSEIQASAILEMKLQKLAGLERKKVEDELTEVQALIKKLKGILKSPAKILEIIKTELNEIVKRYGDDRRTKIVKHGVKSISLEDLIEEEENILVLTADGYVKRINPDEFKKQKRGGVGVIDLNTKEEDFVTKFVRTSTHSDLLFFSDKGKVYQMKMFEIPEGRRATKGKSIMNFLPLEGDEKITSILAMPKNIKKDELALMMITKQGVVKKVDAESFYSVRRSGLIAIKLNNDDELMIASFVEKGDSVILTTKEGQSIRFDQKDIRVMGRAASGVRGIKLNKTDDKVIGASVISKDLKDPELLVISSNGFGKKTSIKEYKLQKRGGSGIKTIKLSPKVGELIASKVISDELTEFVAISQKGQVIRTALSEVPKLGRQTQGVKVMKLRAGDRVASLICL
ncbi:MAG: DNA gyrase subunit A [Candidatus Pacebacteria bacterium]|nr:DNA gyrase subunit A [Candidatus Paceibacterota bacterium]